MQITVAENPSFSVVSWDAPQVNSLIIKISKRYKDLYKIYSTYEPEYLNALCTTYWKQFKDCPKGTGAKEKLWSSTIGNVVFYNRWKCLWPRPIDEYINHSLLTNDAIHGGGIDQGKI